MMLSRTGWDRNPPLGRVQTGEGRRAPWGCAAGAPYRGTASPPPPPPPFCCPHTPVLRPSTTCLAVFPCASAFWTPHPLPVLPDHRGSHRAHTRQEAADQQVHPRPPVVREQPPGAREALEVRVDDGLGDEVVEVVQEVPAPGLAHRIAGPVVGVALAQLRDQQIGHVAARHCARQDAEGGAVAGPSPHASRGALEGE